MFYYIALKYGNFLLETVDTFLLLKNAYTQSRKLYENRISSWYGALQQIWITRETPNRILPNLAHLLILCVSTSVLCGVNKEVKENNNNKKPNPILAFYIQTRGALTTI
jgi:hypothetical protein